jgi:hypothetical protein
MLATSIRNRLRHLVCRGQALVEFTLVLTLALIVLFVSVQLALLGECALALGQMNYQGARYAAVHPCATITDVAAFMVSIGSPSITKNCGGNLSISMQWKASDGTSKGAAEGPSAGSCGTPACGESAANTRQFGDQIQVSITYNAADNLFLPNSGGGFFGITFPTTLKHSETAIVE